MKGASFMDWLSLIADVCAVLICAWILAREFRSARRRNAGPAKLSEPGGPQ